MLKCAFESSGLAGSALYGLLLLSCCIYPGFFPFDVNALLAIGSALLFALASASRKNPLHIPTWPLLAILIITLIQTLLFASSSLPAPRAWSLQALLYLTAALMFFIGANMGTRRLEGWMRIYILVSLLWLAVGWFVWLGGTSGRALEWGPFTFAMAPANKLAGPFNQGNIFAAGIGMGWIFSHWLLLKRGGWPMRLAVIALTAAMVDSLSRGGWLAFIPCLGILLYSLRSEFTRSAFLLAVLWMAGIALGVAALLLSQPESIDKGFLDIAQGAANSLEARLLIWASALTIFFHQPLTGAGWGQFANQFWLAHPEAAAWLKSALGYCPDLPATVLSAHNLTLQLLSEGGILLFLLAMIGLCFYVARIRYLIARSSPRTPFALAALGFLLQAQINVSYSAASLFICASFFAGIAMAPWLRKNSLAIRLQRRIRIVMLLGVLFITGWSIQRSFIWFETNEIIRKIDLADKASLKAVADISIYPRVRTIPLTWLAYKIATERRHYALLRWIAPMLLESAPEIPFVDVYQVLFYTLANTGRQQQACQIGRMIAAQRLPEEKNNQHYHEVCAKQPLSGFHFGH